MILLTDGLFPSKYAQWRIEEIKSFIDRGDTDIIVKKVDSYDGVRYDVDYEIMKEYFNLSQYNILIFDKKYNYLNKFNEKIDGTKFNNLCNYSYIFTKFDNFDIKKYRLIYHIFVSSYNRFNTEFKIPPQRQVIHLYPGGGYGGTQSLSPLPRKVNIICTQPIVTKHVKSLRFENYINVYGSTSLPKTNTLIPKNKNEGILRICFSNMGNAEAKGGNLFSNVVDTYKKLHPDHTVEFIFVGSRFNLSNVSSKVRYIDQMPQSKLNEFYNKEIDILINAENGKFFNGWPLGIDAALQGVVLITTDIHKSNSYFKYTDGMLSIVGVNDTDNIIKTIANLYNNRDILHSMSANIQRHSHQLFSYENQQNKIFKFIEKFNPKEAIDFYRTVCPSYDYENSSYKIKNINQSLLNMENLSIIDDNFPEFIINSIRNKTGITTARYNDGEWIAALKIQDNSLYRIHSVKWGSRGQAFVDKRIFPIIQNKIDYYVGISSEVMKKEYITKHILKYIEGVKLFDGGLFARMSIDNSLTDLFTELKNRNIIIVGPKHLNALARFFNFEHIKTNDSNVWDQYEELFVKLFKSIENTELPVIVYAASFSAKVLIDSFYKLYSNSITQLDIGAALDVYCGINTRPWHHIMEKV